MRSTAERSFVPESSMPQTEGMNSMAPPENELAASSSLKSQEGFQSEGQLIASAGPPVPTGSDFTQYMTTLANLEIDCEREGMDFQQRVSAFRNLYYTGIVWDAIIPRAALNGMPQNWGGRMRLQAQALSNSQVIDIAGEQVDMGHVFAGMDAINHPSPTTAVLATMGNNIEAATWVGDMSAVVGEFYRDLDKDQYANHELNATFINAEWGNFLDTWTEQFGTADLHGDLDAYAVNMDPSLSVHANLYNYYHVAQDGQGRTRRFTRFAQNCGLYDQNLQLIPAQVERVKLALVQATIMYQMSQVARGNTEYSGDSADFGAHDDRDIFGNPKYFREHHTVECLIDMALERFLGLIQRGLSQELGS